MSHQIDPASPHPDPLPSEFASDPDMLEIVELFVQEMPDRISEMVGLWEQRELEGLRRLAHRLKGASGGYGYPQVGSAAAELETTLTSLIDGASADSVRSLREHFDRLVDLCRRVSVR